MPYPGNGFLTTALNGVMGKLFPLLSAMACTMGALAIDPPPGIHRDRSCGGSDTVITRAQLGASPMTLLPAMPPICGIPEPLVWLRADMGWTAGNWDDQTSNNRDGINAGNPTLLPSVLNFNPGVRYDGNDQTTSPLPEMQFFDGTYHATIIAVYQPSTASLAQGILGNQGNTGSNNINVIDGSIGRGSGGLMPAPEFFGATPHLMEYIVDEEDLVSGTANSSQVLSSGNVLYNFHFNENGLASDPNFHVGRSGSLAASKYFDGTFHEFIVYRKADGSVSIPQADRNKMRSYLAMKYGLTLGTSYVNAVNTTLWDIAIDIAYTNRVTAITRDDCFPIDQRRSRSEESGALLTIAHTATGGSAAAPDAFSNDKDFFAVGDDDAPLTLTAPLGTALNSKTERNWKVREHGTVGNVTLSIAKTDLPNTVTHLIAFSNPADPLAGAQFHTLVDAGADWTVEFDMINGHYFSFVDLDNDRDGIDDVTDLDDDNDGIPDIAEGGELLDTDGDGVPNRFDLDSDNDGIYDVVEAGSGQPHTTGILNGAVTALGIPMVVDADANGVVEYTIKDSDADGNIDSLELDSDNDSCTDVIEAGFIDHNGDGELGNVPLMVNTAGVVTSTGL